MDMGIFFVFEAQYLKRTFSQAVEHTKRLNTTVILYEFLKNCIKDAVDNI